MPFASCAVTRDQLHDPGCQRHALPVHPVRVAGCR